ncbi:MAG: DUF4013 domain-containing protein [Candidatus Aenigmatarchaeota archaeon]
MEAIKRPFSDITKLVIGIVVMLIPIVNILGIGYLIRCAKLTFKKDASLPEWTDWVNMFVTGIFVLIIGLIWAIPVMLVAGVTVGSVLVSAAPMIAAGNMPGFAAAIAASAGTLLIGFAIALVVGLIIGLMASVGILRYAEKGTFGAAFEFGAIKNIAFRGDYIAAFVVGLIYTVVVTLILSFIPFIGGAIASFITSVALYTMLAEAYKG